MGVEKHHVEGVQFEGTKKIILTWTEIVRGRPVVGRIHGLAKI